MAFHSNSMALSYVVSEISKIRWKSYFFISQLHSTPC